MIRILTGPMHSGKTTFLKGMACALREMNVEVDGFLSIAVKEKGMTARYNLLDLKRGTSMPLLRKRGEKTWDRAGDYYLLPDGLKEAKKIIRRGQKADLLIVDEVGPMEIRGEGFWPTLRKALAPPAANCMIVVQERVLDDFLAKLGDLDKEVVYLKDKEMLTRSIQGLKRQE